jgi:hypothetical protein
MGVNTRAIGKIRPCFGALGGDGVPLTNARAGLITPNTQVFAAVELIFCARIMPRRCLSNDFPQHTGWKK